MYDLWRMDALNELQAYNSRLQALENIPARIAELEEALTAVRSSTSDGSPVKGGGSGREDAMLNNIVARDRLRASLERTRAAVDRTEKGLGALNADDRRILECFFISPRKGAASQLASELRIEEKTVYNRRNNALRLFQIAMSGDS